MEKDRIKTSDYFYVIEKGKMESNFDKAIDLLIKVNQENRLDQRQLDYVNYLIVACTVHCSAGRGIGKTHYIATHATKEDLIIVQDFAHISYFQKQYGKGIQNNMFAFDQLDVALKGRRFQTVYVDEPNLCFKYNDGNKWKFYGYIADNWNVQTIIMLGE